ncbi:hypothetical protein C5167_044352 [Papaver somniferum]|uniref:Uncharacterized protein n=1 Tax=Papaver somniferum TaxID=3469 RepID=A0A4Y7LC76_PAPSO|nr:hypothetical protein C5167_044352 [Papaver somniferum]
MLNLVMIDFVDSSSSLTSFMFGGIWLIHDKEEDKKLVILKSSNAVNPLVQGEYYTAARLKPGRLIPSSVLKGVKGLAILTEVVDSTWPGREGSELHVVL